MKPNWLGLAVVAVAAVAVLAYKGTRPQPAAHAAATTPAVIMVADPSEADSTCGCGEIIRSVRAAATKGVAVREAAPGSDPALETEYRITVAPTVLVLDGKGGVKSRFEGEDEATLAGLRTALGGLAK